MAAFTDLIIHDYKVVLYELSCQRSQMGCGKRWAMGDTVAGSWKGDVYYTTSDLLHGF
jgi:hypothetical protein